MPTKVKIQTPEGVKEVGISDVRPYWLYDTEQITAAAGTKDEFFFRTPQGKTIRDTNLRQFSTIQVGWTFEVTNMRVIPQVNASLADLEELFGNGQPVITFLREGDIEIFTIPAIMLNAGCGFYGATTVNASDIVSLGTPASGAILKLPIRFLIYGGETFNFRFQAVTTNAMTAAVNISLVLDGILKRGVRGA